MPQDYTEALRWYRQAGKHGYAAALYNLSMLYRRGEGVVKSIDESKRLYQQSAKAGDADAQYSLGELYEKGEWVNSDPVAACNWYRLAAEQEHREAQYRLGRLHEKDLGVHQDFVLAYLWYNLAAARGLEPVRATRDKLLLRMTPGRLQKGRACPASGVPSRLTLRSKPLLINVAVLIFFKITK